MSVQNRLEEYNSAYPIYRIRREEFQKAGVPFMVSPEPFDLNQQQSESVLNLGQDITSYLHTVWELYQYDERIRQLLDKGKPQIFLMNEKLRYLFVRPDLIITQDGFCIAEIETSPFGLALSDMLNKSYLAEGYETMVGENELEDYVQAATPTEGTLLYTERTQAYSGQMFYLADQVFKRNWTHSNIEDADEDKDKGFGYRGYYLDEYLTNPTVQRIIESYTVLPSLTPQFEEKALLSFLWDSRWEESIRKQIGDAAFNHLRNTVPETWIVGEEAYFSPGMPPGINQAIDLAQLSRSKRTFVLKSSGFSSNSSWAEGVTFLHSLSREKATEALIAAQDYSAGLQVIQAFKKPKNNSMTYIDSNGNRTIAGKVRLTPYFAFGESTHEGKLLSIKATAVEDTDIIHSGTHSINTSVSIR